MHSLAQTHSDFGFTRKGSNTIARNRTTCGEALFQTLLHKALIEATHPQDWQWTREARFSTGPHWNGEEIYIDILGIYRDDLSVLIELKYVTTQIGGTGDAAPSDYLAFPYDALKDCIKLELAIDGRATSARNLPSRRYGVSIGLTDFSGFWNPDAQKGNRGWSRNALKALKNPGPVPSLIHTDTPQLEAAIFERGRYHLSFGYPWDLAWHDFNQKFRFLYLRPTLNGPANYVHIHSDPRYIPKV